MTTPERNPKEPKSSISLESRRSLDNDIFEDFKAYGITKVQSKEIAKKYKFIPRNFVNRDNSSNKVYVFTITGGPCAGKTTCLEYLVERFSPRFKVYCLPELASITINAGVNIIPSEFTNDSHTEFTKAIMKHQMHTEHYFYDIAKNQKKDVLIFCDRGMMDNIAYCKPEVADRVFSETGWSRQKITNLRYDAVFHLVTAADGAEKFYTCENNKARTETPEVARMVDKWIQSAWRDHENQTYNFLNFTKIGLSKTPKLALMIRLNDFIKQF